MRYLTGSFENRVKLAGCLIQYSKSFASFSSTSIPSIRTHAGTPERVGYSLNTSAAPGRKGEKDA